MLVPQYISLLQVSPTLVFTVFGHLAGYFLLVCDSTRQENRTFMSLQLVVFCEIIMSIVAPVALMIHFSSSCQKHYLDVSPGAKEELEAGNIFYSDMWY